MEPEEKANNVNNKGVLEAIAKEVKVRTFMTILVIKIGSKKTGEEIMIGVAYMFLLEIGKLL